MFLPSSRLGCRGYWQWGQDGVDLLSQLSGEAFEWLDSVTPLGTEFLEERSDLLPAATATDPQHFFAIRFDENRRVEMSVFDGELIHGQEPQALKSGLPNVASGQALSIRFTASQLRP